MASAVSICSAALASLGADSIASLSEGTRAATLCSNIWPTTQQWLMRKHVWPTTRVQVELAPQAETPAFDWAYKFLLPGDWMRTLQIGERNARPDFEQMGRSIYTDESTLFMVYQRDQTDPSQWDALMVDVATAEMAARLAYPITQSASLAELKRKEADKVLREAKAIAGQDNPAEDWADEPLIAARF